MWAHIARDALYSLSLHNQHTLGSTVVELCQEDNH